MKFSLNYQGFHNQFENAMQPNEVDGGEDAHVITDGGNEEIGSTPRRLRISSRMNNGVPLKWTFKAAKMVQVQTEEPKNLEDVLANNERVRSQTIVLGIV